MVTNPIWTNVHSLSSDFGQLEGRFDEFKKLCKEVARDEYPDQSSWAYHFAKYCVEQGKVSDGIFKAFPLTLEVSSIRGDISYYDYKKGKINYPTNYKRTSFAARIEVIQRNKDGSVSESKVTTLLPFETNGKDAKNDEHYACDEKSTTKTFIANPIRVSVHPFEEVRLVSSVTDWNGNWIGQTNLNSPRLIAMFNSGSLEQLKTIDLSFKLKSWTRRWTGCDTPRLTLSINASITGNSIGDFLNKAKQAVEQKRTKGK